MPGECTGGGDPACQGSVLGGGGSSLRKGLTFQKGRGKPSRGLKIAHNSVSVVSL